MNILLLNWRDTKHPNTGGAEVVTFEHVKAWIKSGHSVTWFTSLYNGAKNLETTEGIEFIRKGSGIFGVHLHAFFWYTFAKHKKFDLVIDQFHGIPFFTPLYVKEKKLAFIHEVAKEVWDLNPWPKPFNLIPAIIGRKAEPFLFSHLYKKIPFVTVSNSTKNDLVAWGIPKKNITVIHNGTTVWNGKNPSPKEQIPTVLYLGSLSKDKGIEDAIKVFSLLHTNHPDWQFWIAGNGDSLYVTKLQSMIEELGIKKNVHFYGYVSEEKKFTLFQKAHVLINPSIREGWGLVIIEAASQKTPAAVYRVAGLVDSVQENITGVIAKENTPNALANEIELLVLDNKRYEVMQKNCYKWSKEFSWQKAVRESLTLITRI